MSASEEPAAAQVAVAELTYTEASGELDRIVAYFEQREVDIDQLVARLERATAIVDELDRRLRRTRAQVEELVPKLEAAAGLAAREPDTEGPADELAADDELPPEEAWDEMVEGPLDDDDAIDDELVLDELVDEGGAADDGGLPGLF